MTELYIVLYIVIQQVVLLVGHELICSSKYVPAKK